MNLNQTDILARLECVKKVGINRYVARCPAHADKNPSLSVQFTETTLLMYCFAGCEFVEVLGALSLNTPDYHSAQSAYASKAVELEDCWTDPKVYWNTATAPSTDHQYLAGKNIQPLGGIRQRWSSLLVPLYNTDGELYSLQYINADGSKKFHKGRSVKGLYTVVGELKDREVYLCEGYATGVSLHQMTGAPVVCCMSASNFEPVAAMLKQRGHSVIIAADNDHRSSKNTGLRAAQRAADKLDTGLITFQPCGERCRCTDFNDVLNCPDWLGEVAR